jgi:hypothetical protein
MTRVAITPAHVEAFAQAAIASYREGNLPLQSLKDMAHTIEMFVLDERVRTPRVTPQPKDTDNADVCCDAA